MTTTTHRHRFLNFIFTCGERLEVFRTSLFIVGRVRGLLLARRSFHIATTTHALPMETLAHFRTWIKPNLSTAFFRGRIGGGEKVYLSRNRIWILARMAVIFSTPRFSPPRSCERNFSPPHALSLPNQVSAVDASGCFWESSRLSLFV